MLALYYFQSNNLVNSYFLKKNMNNQLLKMWSQSEQLYFFSHLSSMSVSLH